MVISLTASEKVQGRLGSDLEGFGLVFHENSRANPIFDSPFIHVNFGVSFIASDDHSTLRS